MTNTLILGKSSRNPSLENFSVDGDEVLYIVRDGVLVSVNNLQEETVVPGAPDGIDGATAADGEVWTADGAGGADWGALIVPPSFSDYSGVIVVDAGGKGDYTTLKDAVAGATAGDIIYVFGDVVDAAYFSFNKELTFIGHGSTWSNASGSDIGAATTFIGFHFLSNVSFDIWFPPLTLKDCTGKCPIYLSGGTANVYNCVFTSGTITVSSSASTLNMHSCYHTNVSNGMQITSSNAVVNVTNSTIISTTANSVTSTLSTLGLAYFKGCTFKGLFNVPNQVGINVVSSEFSQTPTAQLKAGNYSNTVAGVTWPVIP